MPKKIGGIIILSKIRALKEKKGFTLVELIVVLVILAILAALLVPALTGYIDKANDQKVIATTRQVVMAAQTEVSTAYGAAADGKLDGSKADLALDSATKTDGVVPGEIAVLAEVATSTGTEAAPAYTMKTGISGTVAWDANGHVTKVVITQSGRTCTYDGTASTYTCKK